MGPAPGQGHPLTWGNVLPAPGRLAQWESASFTPKRSLVRTQYRPPGTTAHLREADGSSSYAPPARTRAPTADPGEGHAEAAAVRALHPDEPRPAHPYRLPASSRRHRNGRKQRWPEPGRRRQAGSPGPISALSIGAMPAPGAPRPHFVARDGTLRDRFSARRLTDFQDYQWCREKFQPQAAGVNPRMFSKTPSLFSGSTTSEELSWISSPGSGR